MDNNEFLDYLETQKKFFIEAEEVLKRLARSETLNKSNHLAIVILIRLLIPELERLSPDLMANLEHRLSLLRIHLPDDKSLNAACEIITSQILNNSREL